MLGKLNESHTYMKEWLLDIYHFDGSQNHEILINSSENEFSLLDTAMFNVPFIWAWREIIWSDNIDRIISGPKNADNVFGDEELIPFCKFCFAKKFKISALNIAETVTTVPESATIGL